MENRIARTPRTSMGATQKLMGGPNVDLVLLCACAYAQWPCKQRTQRDRVRLKGMWDPTQHGCRQGTIQSGEFRPKSPARERQTGDWTARS